MKRSILIALIIAAVFSVSAQNVTIKATDRDAESVFAELIQQTGKNFIYPAGLLNGLKVTVNASNTPLSEVLDKMFGGTDISYNIKGNNITLKRVDLKSRSKLTISGFVKEAQSNEVLVGATVFDLISGKGTTTNANGFYSLTIPEGKVNLKFQYIGFEPYLSGEFSMNNNTRLNVTLAKPRELKEVTVNASVNNAKAMCT